MPKTRTESPRKRAKRRIGVAFGAALALVAIGSTRPAFAQTAVAPPPTSVEYMQYGVSLHTLTLLDGGSVCPIGARTPCIVGSGGGLGLRMGYRSRGPFYLGASFQLSRLNSSNLLRLAILQRLTVQ